MAPATSADGAAGTPARPRFHPTAGWRFVLARPASWATLTAAVDAVVALIAVPALVGLFQTSLGAAGVTTLTTTTFERVAASPASIALVAAVLLLAVLAIAGQQAVLAAAAGGQQRDPERRLPGPAAIARTLAARAARLARRPSTLLLVPYLLLLAPLGHAAIGSAVTSWVAVPSFVSGELLKSTGGTVLWVGGMLLLWYLNLRLVLTIPILVVTDRTVAQAMRDSWRATGWLPWRALAVVVAAALPALVVVAAAAGISLWATAAADAALPDAAPALAAVGFAVTQLIAFVAAGLALAAQTSGLVALLPPDAAGPRPAAAPAAATRRAARIAWPVAGVAALVGLSAAAWPVLERYADGSALVIAHRGDTAHAVENTIPALEAANAAGADVVEFDVQQTADGDWVVMHDFDLARLAGVDGSVAAMTLAEATAVTVRSDGAQAQIPSMREFVARAVELQQPMLIEIKPHGGETDDYLERFFRILDEEGAMGLSMFHSLSEDVVEGQERLHPEATVGLIVAFALGGGVPPTPADFVVVEESGYSDALRSALHDEGRGLLVWTVNGELAMREDLRDGVDGIITDLVPEALASRDAVADEQGLAPKLLDALARAVTLW